MAQATGAGPQSPARSALYGVGADVLVLQPSPTALRGRRGSADDATLLGSVLRGDRSRSPFGRRSSLSGTEEVRPAFLTPTVNIGYEMELRSPMGGGGSDPLSAARRSTSTERMPLPDASTRAHGLPSVSRRGSLFDNLGGVIGGPVAGAALRPRSAGTPGSSPTRRGATGAAGAAAGGDGGGDAPDEPDPDDPYVVISPEGAAVPTRQRYNRGPRRISVDAATGMVSPEALRQPAFMAPTFSWKWASPVGMPTPAAGGGGGGIGSAIAAPALDRPPMRHEAAALLNRFTHVMAHATTVAALANDGGGVGAGASRGGGSPASPAVHAAAAPGAGLLAATGTGDPVLDGDYEGMRRLARSIFADRVLPAGAAPVLQCGTTPHDPAVVEIGAPAVRYSGPEATVGPAILTSSASRRASAARAASAAAAISECCTAHLRVAALGAARRRSQHRHTAALIRDCLQPLASNCWTRYWTCHCTARASRRRHWRCTLASGECRCASCVHAWTAQVADQ